MLGQLAGPILRRLQLPLLHLRRWLKQRQRCHLPRRVR
jgi:hypothetical protein